MKLKTFILDDEEHSIEVTTHYLSKNWPEVKIVGHAYNIADAYEFLSNNKVDLLFLDVNLKGELGFDLINKMPNANFKVVILSAHSEYGIHAVKHNVCDYLLKPLNSIELVETIGKICALKQNRSNDLGKLAISDKTGINLLNVADIKYLEADGNYTHVYMKDSKEMISMRIGEMMDKLPLSNFIRIHRTYAINVSFVEKIRKKLTHSVCLTGAIELPISRTMRREFHDFLAENLIV